MHNSAINSRCSLLLCLFFVNFSHAKSLQEILSTVLVTDPLIIESESDHKNSEIAIKAAKSGHYPIISVVGEQMINQENSRGISNSKDTDFGLEGKLNLWSWGKINKEIQQKKHLEQYYGYQVDETKEALSEIVGGLYLMILRYQDILDVHSRNLNRHNRIIKDLEVIAKYDSGRRYELTQAKARRLQVEANILQIQQSIEITISQIQRYVREPINIENLSDPFADMSWQVFTEQYQNTELTNLPSYSAQKAAVKSVEAELKVNKTAKLPSVDLKTYASNDRKQIYLSLSWDIFNLKNHYSVAQSSQSIISANARAEQILREAETKARSAIVNMRQNSLRFEQTKSLVAAQQQVIKAHELQFKIARRSLNDVLDAYSELSSVEMSHITSKNDYRDAALLYLRSQGKLVLWVQKSMTVNLENKNIKFKNHKHANNNSSNNEVSLLNQNINKKLENDNEMNQLEDDDIFGWFVKNNLQK